MRHGIERDIRYGLGAGVTDEGETDATWKQRENAAKGHEGERERRSNRSAHAQDKKTVATGRRCAARKTSPLSVKPGLMRTYVGRIPGPRRRRFGETGPKWHGSRLVHRFFCSKRPHCVFSTGKRQVANPRREPPPPESMHKTRFLPFRRALYVRPRLTRTGVCRISGRAFPGRAPGKALPA